jgi:uncharacterized protein
MKLTDGERLIVLMLCDVHKALNLNATIDPEFVKAAVVSGNLRELKWQIDGILQRDQDGDGAVQEVDDILNMWSAVERGYKRLSLEEKQEVEAGAGPLGRGVRFSGFDGETEREHRDIAHFFIEKAGRFERFQGRNLDAHMPTLKGYRRMLGIFAPMQAPDGEARLGAGQIIELANAEKYAG